MALRRLASSVAEPLIAPGACRIEVLKSLLPLYGIADCGYNQTGHGSVRIERGRIRLSGCFSDSHKVLKSRFWCNLPCRAEMIIMSAAACDWSVGKTPQQLLRVTNAEIADHINESLNADIISDRHAREVPVECALKAMAEDYILKNR